MPALDTLRRLLHGAPNPDGQAAALQAVALESEPLLPGPPHRALPRPETVITTALGQKVLHGWMQNRFQTRYPLTLNLRNETPEAAALVVEAVCHALSAVDAGEEERRQAARFLAKIGGALPGGSEPAALSPARLRAAQMGTHAYAACAGALGQRSMVGLRFLSYLAARLDIPDEVARSLNRRFG